jgi:hypothetical protein
MAGHVLQDIAAVSIREHARIAASRGEDAAMAGPDKLAAIADALTALERAGVRGALIGGVAVGIRSGVARATLDTDLAVPSSIDRKKIIAGLVGAGFSLRGEHRHSINFRHASGEPVQLVLDPGFDAMIERAEVVRLDTLAVPVVTTEDLIEMKQRSAADPERRRSKSLQDAADVALLRGDVPDPDEGW